MRRRRHGFTLLEVIIAIAMAAVLAASLYASLAIAFDARDQVRQQTLAPAEAAFALGVLGDDFQSIPVPGEGLAGPFVGLSSGDSYVPADSVDFYVCATDRLTGYAGFRRLSITLVDGEIVRTEASNLLSNGEVEPDSQDVLLTGVAALAFRYFDGYTWLPDWDSSINGYLPYAIEITIILESEAPGGGDAYTASKIIPIPCGGVAPIFVAEEEPQAEADE